MFTILQKRNQMQTCWGLGGHRIISGGPWDLGLGFKALGTST